MGPNGHSHQKTKISFSIIFKTSRRNFSPLSLSFLSMDSSNVLLAGCLLVLFQLTSSSSLRMNNGIENVENLDFRELGDGISGSDIATKLDSLMADSSVQEDHHPVSTKLFYKKAFVKCKRLYNGRRICRRCTPTCYKACR